jgi:hypothetical protein
MCHSTVDALLVTEAHRAQEALLCTLTVLSRNSLCIYASAYMCSKLTSYLNSMTRKLSMEVSIRTQRSIQLNARLQASVLRGGADRLVECVGRAMGAVLECVRCSYLADSLCMRAPSTVYCD